MLNAENNLASFWQYRVKDPLVNSRTGIEVYFADDTVETSLARQ